MNTLKKITFILTGLIVFAMLASAQTSSVAPQRTPEQEASRQTDRMQEELHLTNEQVRQIYDINLRYARVRQQNISRIQAMMQVRNKNAEIEKLLNRDQREVLYAKQFQRRLINTNLVESQDTKRTYDQGRAAAQRARNAEDDRRRENQQQTSRRQASDSRNNSSPQAAPRNARENAQSAPSRPESRQNGGRR